MRFMDRPGSVARAPMSRIVALDHRMETRIWSRVQDKFAHILVLRGEEVHLLKVTGISLTLKGKVRGVLEALEAGRAPADAGGKLVETIDARAIAQAEVSPGNGSVTLRGAGEPAKKLTYQTGDNDADAILRAILERAGRAFGPAQEPIGVVEALIPPAVLGLFGGLLWVALYDSARKLAAGQAVEVSGRRQGMKQLLIGVAEALGTGGTIAVGAVLAALILGWAAHRIVRRPERTVWRPEAA